VTPEDLKQHIAATYRTLRVGLALLGLTLPFVLFGAGQLRAGLELQPSMSAYYHAGDGALRDVFVSFVSAVGALLILYKGVRPLEDWALNFAGLFAIGVAWVPTQKECVDCAPISLHATCAVLFFFCIGYVCVFRASDTLGLIQDQKKHASYKRLYRFIGGLMILSPLAAVVVSFLVDAGSSLVFYVEAAGVLVFSGYWFVKTIELQGSNADRALIDGAFEIPDEDSAPIFRQAPLCAVPPTTPPP
jgi:hypothetical protein